MGELETLVERLVRHEVDFSVVGGYAAMAHGCTLVTMDVDICCDFAFHNLSRLQEALAGLHPVHRMTTKRIPVELTQEFCRNIKNLYMATDLGVLGCLSEVAGVGEYSAVKKHSRRLRMPFGSCRVLNLEALIAAKKAMDRPRDREAALQLEAIKEMRTRGGRRAGR